MKWFFEPGHSAAEFRSRHMMVTWVRGSFKNMHGSLEFDPERPTELVVEANIDAAGCWTGEPQRDDHLRSDDFLACARYPAIRFNSTSVEQIGPVDFKVDGDLTIRDVTRRITLDMHYLGTWQTPWWEDGVDKGPKARAGFTGRCELNRYDFGVSWNSELAGGGVVVSPDISIILDVEAIMEAT